MTMRSLFVLFCKCLSLYTFYGVITALPDRLAFSSGNWGVMQALAPIVYLLAAITLLAFPHHLATIFRVPNDAAPVGDLSLQQLMHVGLVVVSLSVLLSSIVGVVHHGFIVFSGTFAQDHYYNGAELIAQAVQFILALGVLQFASTIAPRLCRQAK